MSMGRLNVYYRYALSSLHLDAAYPAWYWSFMFVTFSKLILMVSFWEAVFDGRELLNDWTMTALMTYAVLSMLLNEYIGGPAWELSALIRQGQVAIELLRPYDILWRLTAQEYGHKFSNALRTAVPLLAVMAFFFPLEGPQSSLGFSIFIGSVLFAIVLGGLVDLLIGMMAFWLENMWGLRVFKSALFLFFTGALIPINLFPEWLQTVCAWTPFPSLVYTPIAIYTGKLSGDAMWFGLGMQLIWLVVIYTVVRVVWRIALRRVTVFGG